MEVLAFLDLSLTRLYSIESVVSGLSKAVVYPRIVLVLAVGEHSHPKAKYHDALFSTITERVLDLKMLQSQHLMSSHFPCYYYPYFER